MSRLLSADELANFRTVLCEAHCNDRCKRPDRCCFSHCVTWQRRNPLQTQYSPALCPDIRFSKKGSKMTLQRKCTRGRSCSYAHSKEEELYHPDIYKTRSCTTYPNCKRFFCPFAHEKTELRHTSGQREEPEDPRCRRCGKNPAPTMVDAGTSTEPHLERLPSPPSLPSPSIYQTMRMPSWDAFVPSLPSWNEAPLQHGLSGYRTEDIQCILEEFCDQLPGVSFRA